MRTRVDSSTAIHSQIQQFAWPFSLRLLATSGNSVTETYSKTRQQAEIGFGQLQTEFFARIAAVEELESVAQARDAKTFRLRKARLAKEHAGQAATTSALLAKRAYAS
jgi:hypothetical protein